MDEALSALDQPSRKTVEALLELIGKLHGKGVGALFESKGQFSGALSAGSFQGRELIEAHFVQVFKRLPKGPVTVGQIVVSDRQVIFEWCIGNPGDASSTPIPARYTLQLGPSGLIQSLRAEWDPSILSKNQRP